MALSKELHKRFVKRHQSTCCRVLTKDLRLGSAAHMAQCAQFTGEVAEDTARIILRERKGEYLEVTLHA